MVSAMPVSANMMAKVFLVPASAGFEVKLSVSHRGAAWCNQEGFEWMVMMVCVGVVYLEPNTQLIASQSS